MNFFNNRRGKLMKLVVTESAAKWYKQELDLKDGDFIRFFVKLYGGNPSIHPNYSLGISKEEPGDIAVCDKKAGVTFYFDEQDEWFIEQHELIVDFQNGEIQFTFKEEE